MLREDQLDPAFSGCVRVRQRGETLLEVSQGYADLANRLPNTPAATNALPAEAV